jgi:hypothetical protein
MSDLSQGRSLLNFFTENLLLAFFAITFTSSLAFTFAPPLQRRSDLGPESPKNNPYEQEYSPKLVEPILHFFNPELTAS